MPEEELREDFSRPPFGSPSISSLSSNSSDVILINAHYIGNGRTPSIRSGSASSEEALRISRFGNVSAAAAARRTNQNDAEEYGEEEELMTYQPIKIPKEPTLEELLVSRKKRPKLINFSHSIISQTYKVPPSIFQRQVVGNSIGFHQVNQIRLRIISSSISLHRLPYFLPQLRLLSLEGSVLFSLRDLGSDLSSLTYLNVSRCALKSLDGTNGLLNLIELVADNNQINDAGACMNLPRIRKISLANNRIQEFQSIMFLGLCAELRTLNLTGNLIAQLECYRETIRANIGGLEMLDGFPFDENMSDELKMDLQRTEYRTGDMLPTRQGLNEMMVNVMTVNARNSTFRPISAEQVTAPATEPSVNPLNNRPASARDTRPKYNISIGEPVCGSVIARARKPKQLRTAWGESCSSSSFSSSDSSTVMAMRVEQEADEGELSSYDELLDSARVWREQSRASRDKFNND